MEKEIAASYNVVIECLTAGGLMYHLRKMAKATKPEDKNKFESAANSLIKTNKLVVPHEVQALWTKLASK